MPVNASLAEFHGVILIGEDFRSDAQSVRPPIILPVSALIELTAVALFALNLIATFARPPVVVASPLTITTE